MTRNLHITIVEAGASRRRRSRGAATGRAGSDPGSDYEMPEPTDPGSDYGMPEPTDPGSGYTMPEVSDPGSDYGMPEPTDPGSDYGMPEPSDPGSEYGMPEPTDPTGRRLAGAGGGAGRWGSPVGAVYACDCPPPTCRCGCGCGDGSDKPTEQRPGVRPRDYSGFVIVRLAAGLVSDQARSLWELAHEGAGLPGLAAVLDRRAAGSDSDLASGLERLSREAAGLPGQAADLLRRAGEEVAELARRVKNDRRPPADERGKENEGGERDEGGEPGPDQGGSGSSEDSKLHPEPEGVLVSRPLIELGPRWDSETRIDPTRERTVSAIRHLEDFAATTPLRPLHSLNAYWRLDLRPFPELVDEVLAELNALAVVDHAYLELSATDPAAGGETLAEDQGYLAAAPVGIGARCVWDELGTWDKSATPLTICDLEQGWQPDHDELGPPLVEDTPVFGANRAVEDGTPGHHGTAVLGQLAATGQGSYGVTGAATSLAWLALTSHYLSRTAKEMIDGKTEDHPFAGTGGHVAGAIANALPLTGVGSPPPALAGRLPLEPGDVLLLEVQRGLLVAEADEADLDAIRLAAAHGVIVVEAAGNGGFDLDGYTDPATGRSLRRGAAGFVDSGAIVVGAARAALPHDRAPFSNYGSRLDCYGWGEAVTTCGFGDLAGSSATDYYTNTFNGTSSASPIIAGAAALIQAIHWKCTGNRLVPLAMRAVLSDPATGTRQGAGVAGHIGVMPDLCAIVGGRLGLAPDLYLRRHPYDDGAAPCRGAEISSSPDILAWKDDPVEAQDRFADDLLRAYSPAPGWSIAAGETTSLFVRLRNRGGRDGEARVQLFASPAATLITPERWQPIEAIASAEVPRGDTLTVVGPVPWTAPDEWFAAQPGDRWHGAVPGYSFLAVQRPPEPPPPPQGEPQDPLVDRGQGLPPGPPYFDWAEYRRFLRGPGVAWRNAHRVESAGRQSMALAFLIAGTPDEGRRFGLEVTRRLPAGSKVTLEVPQAFAAKLRQRQPWIDLSTPPGIVLPERTRVSLGRVHLPAGARIPAVLRVEVEGGQLGRGHSLAIRQLWGSEEVGRITWWVVEPRAGGGPGKTQGPPTQKASTE